MQKKLISGLALGAMVLGLGYGLVSASTASAHGVRFSSESNDNSNDNSNVNAPVPPKVYTECLVTAIKKRDAAVLTGWNTFSGAIVEAYTARPLALEAAWFMPTSAERVTAVKAAWKSFKDARKTARKNFNRVRYEAWKTFKTDRKLCPSAPGDKYDGGGHGVDSEPAHMDR